MWRLPRPFWGGVHEDRAGTGRACVRRRAQAQDRRCRDPAPQGARRPLGRRRSAACHLRRAARRGGTGRHRPALPGHRPGVLRDRQPQAAARRGAEARRAEAESRQPRRHHHRRGPAHGAARQAHDRQHRRRPRHRAGGDQRQGHHHRAPRLHRPRRRHRRHGGGARRLMYSPSYNRLEDRAELLEFMRANSFAVLVTGTGGTLHASHLPVMVHEEGNNVVLDMHMAKANAQWKEFFDDEVLVMFSGPHAYVSPRWYEERERVPTWNYAAVHAYGVPKVVSDPKMKYESQRHLVAALDPQWLPQFDALRQEYVQRMLDGIVNFQIAVTRLETRWKRSQNRSRREQELIAEQLERSSDSAERALAALTRKHLSGGCKSSSS